MCVCIYIYRHAYIDVDMCVWRDTPIDTDIYACKYICTQTPHIYPNASMCFCLSIYSTIVFLFTKAQQIIIHSLLFKLGDLQPLGTYPPCNLLSGPPSLSQVLSEALVQFHPLAPHTVHSKVSEPMARQNLHTLSLMGPGLGCTFAILPSKANICPVASLRTGPSAAKTLPLSLSLIFFLAYYVKRQQNKRIL